MGMQFYVFILMLLSCSILFGSAKYDITPLGPLGEPYYYGFEAPDDKLHPTIYDDGTVIGTIYKSKKKGGSTRHAFYYNIKDGFKIIDPFGGKNSEAHMINQNGIVVGSFKINKDQHHYFYFDTNTNVCVDLMDQPELQNYSGWSNIYITPDNQIYASIEDVNYPNDVGFSFFYNFNKNEYSFDLKDHFISANSKGQMVGSNYGYAEYKNEITGWFYDPKTGFGNFDSPEKICLYPQVISENGAVAGQTDEELGFYWNVEDGLILFDPLEGFVHRIIEIYFTSSNKNGVVLGGSNIDGVRHPVIFSKKTGLTDLGTVKGEYDTVGYAINDSNQVVGYSIVPLEKDKYFKEPAAFVWDVLDGMKNLNCLIPKKSGWQLTHATSINNKGQIVGLGYFEGQQQLFLLTPKP